MSVVCETLFNFSMIVNTISMELQSLACGFESAIWF